MRYRQLAVLVSIAFLTSPGLLSADGKTTTDTQKPDPKTLNPPRVNIEPRAKPNPNGESGTASPRANIRIDTTVVQIPVTVTDQLNRFVTGLDKENFRIFEDKAEQTVTYFSSEDAPLSIGLVFDTSGSMGSKLEKSREAVAQFFKTANPEDEFFLVEFNDHPELVNPFTKNLEEVSRTA